MTVDESIIRSLAAADFTSPNCQYYTTTPTCSTEETFEEHLTRENEIQCLTTASPIQQIIIKSESPTPKDPVEELRKTKMKLEDARKRIKTLSEKVRRQEARLKNFDHQANDLKYEAHDAAEILAKNLQPGTKQLLKRIAIKTDFTSNEDAAYHEDLKSYAIALYGISPRAYEFVRESFNKALPSTSRVRQWKHEPIPPPLTFEPIQLAPMDGVQTQILQTNHSGLYVVEQRAAVENLLEEL
jgi:hypothetical protein